MTGEALEYPPPPGTLLSTLEPVVVIVLLIALAVVPLLVQVRIRELRARIVDVADPARALVTELQLRLSLEAVGARGFMLTGQESYAAVYREARRDRASAYVRLLPLADRLGESIAADAAELGRVFTKADSLLAGLIDRRVPVERFIDQLPQREAAFTQATGLVARMDLRISGVTAAQRAAIRSAERLGVVLTSILALLALCAAIAVARLMADRRRGARQREALLAAERHARQASEAARKELERITESRAALMRGFGHDVKNPLGAALGHLDLLEHGIIGPVSDAQRESLSRAHRSVRAALRLIGDLIAVARADTIDVEIGPVDLAELIEELVEEDRAMAAARKLRLDVVVDPAVAAVQTDPRRVRQVVANLLSNAIKYTPRGTVTVRVTTRRGELSSRSGCWVVVEVADTGPGIPEEQREQVFGEFQRLATAAGTEGSGIGLAISRRLARALGGDLLLTSEVGAGSTFALWLPA